MKDITCASVEGRLMKKKKTLTWCPLCEKYRLDLKEGDFVFDGEAWICRKCNARWQKIAIKFFKKHLENNQKEGGDVIPDF